MSPVLRVSCSRARRKANVLTPTVFDTRRWVIFVMTIITFVLSIVVVASCRFLTFRSDFFSSRRDGIHLGLYSADLNTDSCIEYPDGFFEGASEDEVFFKASRGFGVATIVLLGISWILILITLLVPMKEGARRGLWITSGVQIGVSIATSFGIASLYGIDACTLESSIAWCQPGTGGYILAVNLVLLIVLSICTCATPVPIPVCGKNQSSDNTGTTEVHAMHIHELGAPSNVTEIYEQRADGTVEHRQEKTNPDGSIEVTKTVYPRGSVMPNGAVAGEGENSKIVMADGNIEGSVSM